MKPPSLLLLLGFMQHHGGLQGLLTMAELLNSGMKHGRIAGSFNMDPGQFSHLVTRIFLKHYVLHPELQAALDMLEQRKRETYENQRRESARILRLATSHGVDQEKTG